METPTIIVDRQRDMWILVFLRDFLGWSGWASSAPISGNSGVPDVAAHQKRDE